MPVVFVNYRVREQPAYATLLHHAIAEEFGGAQVFIASRSVAPGDDYVRQVFATLRRCEVVLALIGSDWLGHLGEGDDDWVQRELREAFASGIRVIPVLLEDAEMPGENQLPDGIAALARRQALRLRHYSVESDLALLLAELRRVAPSFRSLDELPVDGADYCFAGGSPSCRFGVVPGTIRNVRAADVWVNSENTDLDMSRHNDFTISGIIRHWGSFRDQHGHVVRDVIAHALEANAGPRRPVAPGTTVVTESGALAESNQVRYVVHVASVQGEPGAGYRQVRNLDLCITNVLRCVEDLADRLPRGSVLFPLLGTGSAGAEVDATARTMVAAAVAYVRQRRDTGLRRIMFLGYNPHEYRAIEAAFGSNGLLPAARSSSLP
jgi:O-acetyl-ADP-ribose deacetylase (regulator of RNase III)